MPVVQPPAGSRVLFSDPTHRGAAVCCDDTIAAPEKRERTVKTRSKTHLGGVGFALGMQVPPFVHRDGSRLLP